MEMYNVSDNGNGESYLIQGTESYPSLTTPFLKQFDAMYNGGAAEFIGHGGLYYPTATNYGYYCTGFELPGEWEDHYKIFGVDGPDFQHAGAQTESLPYVYYTTSYGYAQSPYNPYNPYIPDALIGVDGPFVGAQQYYTAPPFHDHVRSPAYVPVVIPPDIISNSFPDPLMNGGASIANRPDGRGFKNSVASASTTFPTNPPKAALNQKNSLTKVSEVTRAQANTGPSAQAVLNGNVHPDSSTAASSHALQGRTPSGFSQPLNHMSNGKVLPHRNQVKVALPNDNGFSDFRSSACERSAVDKLHLKIGVRRPLNNVGGNPNLFALSEQNRGPKTNKSRIQLAVKTYTTKAGINDAEGNIIINTDLYNKEDFQIDCVDAKFFVIKSYSEDDVHKSIKYGVWSSTSHGNKKLQSAYEDVPKLAAGCPIFLFFSVNASSQFCGVAEMIGPVDFHKDVDFWQQDKWSGSFPVKWHIIKDVPNTCFRHIVLDNNENKPVTNSRDTQEIMNKKGVEMLKIFKNHPLNTSLIDDFMCYEKREKFMREEKARLLLKSFHEHGPFFLPALGLADKLNHVVQLPSKEDEMIHKNDDSNSLEETVTSAAEKNSSNASVTNSSIGNGNAEQVGVEERDEIMPLRAVSLPLNSKPAESKPLAEVTTITNSESRDVFTVGSMPIKVNGFAESSGGLTAGTIPLDPKALQLDKRDASSKTSAQN